MDQNVLAELRKRKKNDKLIRTVVRLVVLQLREIKDTIPNEAFKVIARKIVYKYPEIFQDVDDDNIVIGDGTYSLSSKLLYHNAYSTKRGFEGVGLPINVKIWCNRRARTVNYSPPPNCEDLSNTYENKNWQDIDDIEAYMTNQIFITIIDNQRNFEESSR